MSEEERQRIDINPIRRYVLREFRLSRMYMREHPGDELLTSLLVVTGNLFDHSQWTLQKIVFPVFDENRFALLEIVAREYARKNNPVVAVILTSEAWMSMIPIEAYKAHPENRIEPRLDPDRKEMLMVSGLTLDLQGLLATAQFKRSKDGVPIFEQMILMSSGSGEIQNNVILENFMIAYAKEIQARKI